MRNLKYLIPIIILATGCSKPVANFLVEGEPQLTHSMSFVNQSSNAEKYIWKIDNKIVSEKDNIEFCFFESGRHTIELIASNGTKTSSSSNEIFIDPSIECLVLIRTSSGDMIFSLNEETPNHLHKFITTVNSGYYDGISFHRIIDGFMIQAGDENTRKTKFAGNASDVIDHEINASKYHTRGALAAARMPDNINPNKQSSGTQFYIVDGRSVDLDRLKDEESSKLINYTAEQIEDYLANGGAPQLDGEYTVFGQMIKGFDVLEKISQARTDDSDKPIEDIVIIEAKILN